MLASIKLLVQEWVYWPTAIQANHQASGQSKARASPHKLERMITYYTPGGFEQAFDS